MATEDACCYWRLSPVDLLNMKALIYGIDFPLLTSKLFYFSQAFLLWTCFDLSSSIAR